MIKDTRLRGTEAQRLRGTEAQRSMAPLPGGVGGG